MIRKAQLSDLEQLKNIYNDAILTTTATYDLETKDDANRLQWFEEHQQDPYVILVDEEEGRVRGYASLSQYRDRKAFDLTVEVSIYIGKEDRGQGVGNTLMREVLFLAEANPRIHTVISLITSDNQASISLHEKYGFTFCGKITQVGRKFDRWLDLSTYQLFFAKDQEVQHD